MPPSLSKIVNTIRQKSIHAPAEPSVNDLLRGRAADQRSEDDERAAAAGALALAHAVCPPAPQHRGDVMAAGIQFREGRS